MLRIAAKITYKDGREQTFAGGSVLVTAWEKYALRHGYPVKIDEAPRMLSMLVIAHKALQIEEGFDVWLETVDGLEDVETEAVPPTRAAPSADSVSSSPSSSDGDPPTSQPLTIASSRP